MSRSWASALLAAGGLCASCSVPSLESFGAKACDASHPCADGFTCVGGADGGTGACQPLPGSPCGKSGEAIPCGSSVGICQPGTMTCGSDGLWTACVGGIGPQQETCNGLDDDCDGLVDDNVPPGPACEKQLGVCAGSRRACIDGGYETPCAQSYGPSYQPVETKCDGLDNDCNGAIDFAPDGGFLTDPDPVTGACELTQGVCAGARRACVNGSYEAPCGAASYGPSYEAFETRCDGLDNDCDGQVDAWQPFTLYQGTGGIRRPAIAGVPGIAASEIVLFKASPLLSRVVRSDGTLGPSQVPSISLNQANGALAPAIATDGTVVAAAWIEQLPSNLTRVMLTTLDGTGLSDLSGGGAVPIYTSGSPSDVAVATGNGAVLVAIRDDALPGVVLYRSPLPLPSSAALTQVVAPTSSQNLTAIATAWGTFTAAWADDAGIAAVEWASDGGLLSATLPPYPGAASPQLATDRSGGAHTTHIYFQFTDGGTSEIASLVCKPFPSCNAGAAYASSPAANQSNLTAPSVPGSTPPFAAWQQDVAGSPIVGWFSPTMTSARRLSPMGSGAARPSAALTSDAGNAAVAWCGLTDGGISIVVQPVCIPDGG